VAVARRAIRPFIKRYPKKTMAQMCRWAKSGDENVRRLASEGSRPPLPWGGALDEFQKDPGPILPVLERLKDDPSEYVRPSVANNLNDISRDHPELTLEIAKRWLAESRERKPLLKHALRGLLKKGDPRAMELLGLEVGASVKVVAFEVTPRRIQIGGVGSMNLELMAGSAELVRLEYVITYARPHRRDAQKVFQIKETRLEPGKRMRITRKLDFSDRSTRKHPTGGHSLTLAINGNRVKSVRFSLVAPRGLTGRGKGTRPRAPRR
jgi:3-methyladenine DNA glycosylase AlkC